MQGKLAGADEQHITNAAWAIAAACALDACSFDATASFWAAAAPELQQRHAQHPGGFSSEGLRQLYQVQRVAQLLGAGQHVSLPQGLAAATELCFRTSPDHSKPSSGFQSGVTRIARRLLVQSSQGTAAAAVPELVDPRYPSPIDCALLWRGCPVALQADGPTHFLLDGQGQPCSQDGSTQLRDSILRLLGWLVVVVPGHEWAQLGGNAAKEDYLRRRLDAAAGSRPALWLSRPEMLAALGVLHNALPGGLALGRWLRWLWQGSAVCARSVPALALPLLWSAMLLSDWRQSSCAGSSDQQAATGTHPQPYLRPPRLLQAPPAPLVSSRTCSLRSSGWQQHSSVGSSRRPAPAAGGSRGLSCLGRQLPRGCRGLGCRG
jgi:hypothetical protein